MQVYWMRNAFLLKEEQYDNSVRIAMKSVLNRLLEAHTDSALRLLSSPDPCVFQKTEVGDVISEPILDSLIKAEMRCMQVGDAYEYMIYNPLDGTFSHFTTCCNPGILVHGLYGDQAEKAFRN
jgi:hypothetical protein